MRLTTTVTKLIIRMLSTLILLYHHHEASMASYNSRVYLCEAVCHLLNTCVYDYALGNRVCVGGGVE